MFEHIIAYYTSQQDIANKMKQWVAGDAFWSAAQAYCDLQNVPQAQVPAWRRGLNAMEALPVPGMLNGTAPSWR